MTTNYPPGNTPTEPLGPRDVPPDRDAAWGCLWWWWIVFLIIILIVWFGGWGWGSYGGWWYRGRRAVPPPAPNPTVPGTSGAPANPVPPATHPTMRLVPPGAHRAPTVVLTAPEWPASPMAG
jgi:hypothetical protein